MHSVSAIVPKKFQKYKPKCGRLAARWRLLTFVVQLNLNTHCYGLFRNQSVKLSWAELSRGEKRRGVQDAWFWRRSFQGGVLCSQSWSQSRHLSQLVCSRSAGLVEASSSLLITFAPFFGANLQGLTARNKLRDSPTPSSRSLATNSTPLTSSHSRMNFWTNNIHHKAPQAQALSFNLKPIKPKQPQSLLNFNRSSSQTTTTTNHHKPVHHLRQIAPTQHGLVFYSRLRPISSRLSWIPPRIDLHTCFLRPDKPFQVTSRFWYTSWPLA